MRSQNVLLLRNKNKNSAEGNVVNAKSSFPHDYFTYLYYILILVYVLVFSQKVL